MMNLSKRLKLSLCAMLLSLYGGMMFAQHQDALYSSDIRLDSALRGQLQLEFDNLSFFKDNEYTTTFQKGYTLPGFWLQAKTSYYPLQNLKLEAGIHSIWFWGTTQYPAFAYKDVATWRGKDYAHNVHLLPYFRAHLDLSPKVSIVVGDIYGGKNHRLIEPLYNTELVFTSDPETGVQLLYNTDWMSADLWIDWMSYIYKLDTHQEAFAAGLSSRFEANTENTPLHIYFPLQWIVQHRGGEIDIAETNVNTMMNGAMGAGIVWNTNRRLLKSLGLEYDLATFAYPKGKQVSFKKGCGHYMNLTAQLYEVRFKTAYWTCSNFVSIYGNPFYGSISAKTEGMLYHRPKMLYAGFEYVKPLAKGIAFGVFADWHYHLSGKMYSNSTGDIEPSAFGSNNNFSGGICLRANPSFLLKQF